MKKPKTTVHLNIEIRRTIRAEAKAAADKLGLTLSAFVAGAIQQATKASVQS